MKLTKLFTLILSIFMLAACVKKEATLTINIDYGNNKHKVATLEWKKDITALEALEYVSIVETHPLGKYVFVTGIDSVNGIRGDKAWYYTINNAPTKTLAINKKLNAGDTISWIYKKDVCSCTVDNKK